jgi:lipoyl(octanoyl) transferase
MGRDAIRCSESAVSSLQVYLLGMVEFEAALAVQRRLVYEVAGNPESAALVLCEHPHTLTIGREGSWRHVGADPLEFRSRRWPVRWVNRGGGCILQTPGQLAIYPILPLDRLGLGLRAYLDRLGEVLIDVLDDFSIRAHTRPPVPAIWVSDRPIARLGVAVRDWVSYYGAFLNINPNLDHFRMVHGDKETGGWMTSLERERHGPLRTSMVRERVIEYFAKQFGIAQTYLFTEHPLLRHKATRNAFVTPS